MRLFDLFFTTKIPESLQFRSFSWHHMALVAVIALWAAASVRYQKRLAPEKKVKMLCACTFALPCVYLFRFTVFLLLDLYVEPQMDFMDRLPFQLCSMNAIVMPVAVLRKNEALLNYMYAIAMPGAVAAMLTPALSYYGKYFYFGWQVVFFFLDHGLMVLVTVLAVHSGLFRPNARCIPKIGALFLAYAGLMFLTNKLFNQNYLFLNYPDQGTVMSFFARYLGNPGYLLPLVVLAGLIICGMYLPWILADKRGRRAGA